MQEPTMGFVDAIADTTASGASARGLQGLLDSGGIEKIARHSTAKVHERLRAAILKGELGAGLVVSQVELAKALGVSRTPLREAIRLLQSEGLVEAPTNQRVRVSGVSWSDLEQVYAIRISLEATGISLTVPHLTAQAVALLRTHLDHFEQAAEAGDRGAAAEAHAAFHMGLVAHTGDRMKALIHDLWDHSERYRMLFFKSPVGEKIRMRNAQIEHEEIVEACARGDGDRAAALLARHLARTALTILAERAPEWDPTAVRCALQFVAPAGKEGKL
jgi:DNA-binding GntR family transcriptional regulator